MNDNMFGGEGIWLFAILALLWGGNGFFGNRGAEGRVATVEDLSNQSNFSRLESQVQSGFGDLNGRITNLGNGICSLGYDMATSFGSLSKELAECCCGTQRAIDSVKYENALSTASINATTTAGIQKILDKLCEQQTSALTARVNQLELDKAMCGIVRYPLSATYSAGYPFGCGYGCGYQNI